MYAGRPIRRREPSFDHPRFYLVGEPLPPDDHPIWSHPNATMSGLIRMYAPAGKLVAGYPDEDLDPVPTTGWGAIPLAADFDTSGAYKSNLLAAARFVARVIAQQQHAAGLWRGYGTEDSAAGGARSVGGAATVDFGAYYGYNSRTSNCWPTICPLFANPHDTITGATNTGAKPTGWTPEDFGGTVQSPNAEFNWWTGEGRALGAIFGGAIRDALQDECDGFTPDGITTQPVCYPKHWHLDLEQGVDPRILWYWTASPYVTLGWLPDAFNDARYATEVIGLLDGEEATLEEFWEARPGSFSLPADGTPFSDPSAYPLDHWMYSVEFASKGWALARALKDPLGELVPATSVTNYEFIATKSDTTYYQFGSVVFQYATTSPGTDASAPPLYPDRSFFDGAVWPGEEPPIGPQRIVWRGRLDACKQFVSIIPWIGHPDKLLSTTAHHAWLYGPRSFFREQVRICAGEYGITEFIVFMEEQVESGAPDTLSVINEAVNIVRGLRPRVPIPIIRSMLTGRSRHPPVMR